MTDLLARIFSRNISFNLDKIDSEIQRLEDLGEVGDYDGDNMYSAPQPNVHGQLTCLRDNRKYSPKEIENVCLNSCPYNRGLNGAAASTYVSNDCFDTIFDEKNGFAKGFKVILNLRKYSPKHRLKD